MLRRAARELIPQELLNLPKKGFSVPIAQWLRADLREMAHDVLLDRTAAQRGLLSRPRVEGILRDHCEGRHDWDVQIYALLMLELWFRGHVDASACDDFVEDTRHFTCETLGMPS